MKLTPAQHQYIARRDQWYFDVASHLIDDRGDSDVLTGDGLEDLNSAVAYVNRYPRATVVCEVGADISAGNAFPKYMPIDVEDLYAIKDAFIAFYGSVARPSWREFTGGAVQVS